MIFDSTKDILYIVIAFCILWITVFMCWMFYYIARILRNASQIVEEFRIKLQMLSETVNHMRTKIEYLSDLFTFGTSGVGGMVAKMASRHAKKAVDKGTEAMNKVAKQAVDKAVKATVAQVKKKTKNK
ncbi:MAG: hypothetical protein ABH832_01665 [bacterium]